MKQSASKQDFECHFIRLKDVVSGIVIELSIAYPLIQVSTTLPLALQAISRIAQRSLIIDIAKLFDQSMDAVSIERLLNEANKSPEILVPDTDLRELRSRSAQIRNAVNQLKRYVKALRDQHVAHQLLEPKSPWKTANAEEIKTHVFTVVS